MTLSGFKNTQNRITWSGPADRVNFVWFVKRVQISQGLNRVTEWNCVGSEKAVKQEKNTGDSVYRRVFLTHFTAFSGQPPRRGHAQIGQNSVKSASNS